MKFTLDEKYMCDVVIDETWSMYRDTPAEELTDEQILSILQERDRVRITYTEDHPEFTKLREQLGRDGYIEIQRSWSNGDRVLKPFQLNDVKYRKGNRFPCAVAMGVAIHHSRKSGTKYKPD